MSIPFLLFIHRRPRAGRYLDADISLLLDQGVPNVLPCRRAVLHQSHVPPIEPRQGRRGVESRIYAVSAEIFAGSHLVHHRDRTSHRSEIRKCKNVLFVVISDLM